MWFKEGCSSISPEDGIILISCHHSLVNAEKLAKLISAALQQYHWDNACIRFGSLNRHFDNLDRDRLRFIIPFTYFDINPQAGMPVLLGDIVTYTLLDENRVNHELERKGYKFHYDDQRLMMTSPNGLISETGQSMWDRAIYGLLSLQSFVETTELVCQWAESEWMRAS